MRKGKNIYSKQERDYDPINWQQQLSDTHATGFFNTKNTHRSLVVSLVEQAVVTTAPSNTLEGDGEWNWEELQLPGDETPDRPVPSCDVLLPAWPSVKS